VDLAPDAAKLYANTDILRVHLDSNIITPNKYYNITFYVQGNKTLYNGMLGYQFNFIYIGIPPKGGLCSVTPSMGVANATVFTFTSSSWIDPDGIQTYSFYYSFDNGVTFISLENSSPSSNTMTYKFPEIFKSITVTLECNVVSLKGFEKSVYASFPLAMRSAASSSVALSNFHANTVQTETAALQAVTTL